MRAERLVLDTNVVISGLLFTSSTPARILDHALAHCRVVVTDSLLRELVAIVTAPKFDKYAPRAAREAALSRLAPIIEVVHVLQIVLVCRDVHDDAVLEAALNGRADAIVSGDRDLLALHPFRAIAILSPSEYLARGPAEAE